MNMPQSPLLSIITVVYNGEEYLEQTIQSIMRQKSPQIEYFIADGGSTDGTLAIIKKYESQLSGWVSEKDRGLYDAKNKSLQRVTGQYVSFIAADDFLLDGCLAQILPHLEKGSADIYYGSLELAHRTPEAEIFQVFEGNHQDLKKEMSVPFPSCFVKRQLYLEHPFDLRFRIASDYDFMLGRFQAGQVFQKLNIPITRMRLGGVSNQRTNKTLWERYLIQRKNKVAWPYPLYMLLRTWTAIQKNRAKSLLTFTKG